MRNIIFGSLVFMSLMLLSSCGETSANTSGAGKHASTVVGAVTHVDAAGFKALVDKKAGVLIDVRTAREYQSGAIPGTKLNIDVRNAQFKAEMNKLDKNQTYLVYCRSGGRSGQAVKLMESMGFKHIYNLKHGFMGWKRAGY